MERVRVYLQKPRSMARSESIMVYLQKPRSMARSERIMMAAWLMSARKTASWETATVPWSETFVIKNK